MNAEPRGRVVHSQAMTLASPLSRITHEASAATADTLILRVNSERDRQDVRDRRD